MLGQFMLGGGRGAGGGLWGGEGGGDTGDTHTLLVAVTKRQSVRAWPCVRGSACVSVS